MRSECQTFHQELANKLSVKLNEKYSEVINWISCYLGLTNFYKSNVFFFLQYFTLAPLIF